jgi:ABC-2 type transport system permease protein
LESVNYMIPALMGLILQFLATFVTSMAIVREREYNTMEQLVVTPIKPAELVLGKTVPYVLLSLFDLVEVLIIGILWFGVPIHGSLMLLLALSALFLLGSLGIGILISTVSSTQQEAMLLSFLILLPSIFLSGFFFPLEAMPWVLQALSYLVPLRYMLIIMRGIVLKGVGMTILHSEVIFLTIFSVLTLVVAARRFRKSLD